jgi:hypothetical protein
MSLRLDDQPKCWSCKSKHAFRYEQREQVSKARVEEAMAGCPDLLSGPWTSIVCTALRKAMSFA